ncbi:acylglycerol lipase [Aureococcus anophagefferens]|nr:acylglycerol lipase [Aureococcus anophagefferens]
MRRTLRGPALTIEPNSVVRIRFLKATTFVLALLALIAAACAAAADGRHHREVLRCTRHASRSKRLEDNDCVLTETPRGVDRLFEKRRRSSFEIAGAELRLEMSNALRTRTLRRRCNSSDADAVREVVAAMARDIEAGGVPAKKGRGPPQRQRRPPPALRPGGGLARRGAAYLGASARDTGAPVSLALRFDDSGADEVLVFLCLVLLACAMARPALETTTFDTTTEVVSIKRRNLFGVVTFDLCVAFENVDALARRESHPRAPLPGVIRAAARVGARREYGLRLSLNAFGGKQPETADFVRRCLDVDLSFGDKFADSAALKRAVEAANASLLAAFANESARPAKPVESSECAVCLVHRKDAVLAPCGHMGACFRCATRLHRQQDKCPICRATIEHVVKVYTRPR